MKPLATVALSVVLSAVVALGIGFVLMDGRGSGEDLANGQDGDIRLARAIAEIDRISESQAALEDRVIQSLAAPDTEGIRRMRSSLELEIAGLKDQLARVAQDLEDRPTRAAGSDRISLASLGDEETAAALAAYVDEKVEEQVRKTQKSPFRQFAPMAKMNMSRQLSRTAKKLGLDPVQTERLTKASNEAFDEVYSSVEVMMDPSADAADKEKALADVQVTMESVSADAESYMTSEQHSQFLAEQEKQMKQMDRMRNMWSGSSAPAGPAPGRSRTTGGSN